MRRQRGFSLIELLIVVAIIFIIAGIAIPNLLRARMAANESSGASAMRTMSAAEVAYYSSFPQIGYAAALTDLGFTIPCTPAPTHACLLDNNLASAGPGSAGHSGYQFDATGLSKGSPINSDFVVGATPVNPNRTGTRDFCAITDGVLRSEPTTGGMPVKTTAGCLAYPVAQ